ncbi:AbgT family transporter [Streptomyces sp. NPDC048172]|uniref:AbgT family transporter n=1 Tax=Streptomyces sp. NPDC048172 TaxID=3365505 RepID=UPI003720F789
MLSWALALGGVSAESPGEDGKTIAVRNLISGDGIRMMVTDAVENYATFPPLATILVVMLGVAVADRTGLLSAMLRAGVGTLASLTLPLALTMLVAWTLLFYAWYALGIPLGPGVPVR